MLFDRKIDFSDDKKEEWELVKSKVGEGMELPLPDSERWFRAYVDGDSLRVESAVHNVRPLKVYETVTIDFDQFHTVAIHYNNFLEMQVRTMSETHEIKELSPNLRYIFMLIYHLV